MCLASIYAEANSAAFWKTLSVFSTSWNSVILQKFLKSIFIKKQNGLLILGLLVKPSLYGSRTEERNKCPACVFGFVVYLHLIAMTLNTTSLFLQTKFKGSGFASRIPKVAHSSRTVRTDLEEQVTGDLWVTWHLHLHLKMSPCGEWVYIFPQIISFVSVSSLFLAKKSPLHFFFNS